MAGYMSQAWRSSALRPTRLVARYAHATQPAAAGGACTEIIVAKSTYESGALDVLRALRPDIRVCLHEEEALPDCLWTAFRSGVQLESTLLEGQYLGAKKLSDEDTADVWNKVTTVKREYRGTSDSHKNLGDGGELQRELDTAIAAVSRASYMVRSLQHTLLSTGLAPVSKVDSTPVTIADFAAQALIIDAISSTFPQDLFVAEEDSGAISKDPVLLRSVQAAVEAATGEAWTGERLVATLDKGGYDGSIGDATQRVWVLDPIDGTKGFMRGEHYCVALGLLVGGRAVLSTMGCPNLNLRRLLQGSSYDNKNIGYIDPPRAIALVGVGAELVAASTETNSTYSTGGVPLFSAELGSIYFAVTGRGAFARSLSMPLGGAFEVSPSMVKETADAQLCESAEAVFGDRDLTCRVAKTIGLRQDFARIDGMCKHCVVGVGGAEGTLRLPPKGYREKIWDHVAGDHFVREAGGTVTDLLGRQLDYTYGRELAASVEGVVITNGLLHQKILSTVQAEKLAMVALKV
ncbi:hypothetical protein B484DRAFT_392041 [Ochromonadaceae sp. CCMP2298]|nr:hypothetical protein B484DRAFT_392041 [Ochromonadaceae sp. CCMP2298]|eukprot:CAMPEP_0173234194 /NCGR_PEP_ID=MMETSP1142-20121109/10073_1 /TAXON_ID=483371 /ORGANISM="non described non described, Strain CCMP2298" /LENGTH=519 /DNA_ID=CAMNT_0014164173 /DNA_START=47 /DNA_END=1606 /DNA_ORIENTATION=-